VKVTTVIAKVTQKSSSYLGNYETLLLSASLLCRQSTLCTSLRTWSD